MCGRFVQIASGNPDIPTKWAEVVRAMRAWSPAEENYNLAPTQRVAAVLDDEGAVVLRRFRWGLIPPWAKDAKAGYSTINARLETVAEKPAFRAALKAPRRCLVPMAGYYEWRDEDGGKQPYYITHANHEQLWAAGLWEPRHQFQDDNEAGSVTLITHDAEDAAGEVHDRMPVFLPADLGEQWMKSAPDEAMQLLIGAELPPLVIRKVSRKVNNSRNCGTPDMIEPVG